MSALLLMAWVLAADPAPAAAPTAPTATPAAPAPAPAKDSLPGITGTPVRVENRLLVKDRRFFTTAGLSYLTRGDYYVSPGLSGAASYFVGESSGLEARLDLFVSWLSPGAQEVFNATGLLPDAHRPIARIAGGYRHSLAYGKVLALGAYLLHFDFLATAHVGLLVTDRSVAPSVAVGPGLLVRLTDSLFLQADVPVFASFESRRTGFFHLGSLPTVTIGVRP